MEIDPKNNFILAEFVGLKELTGSKLVMPGTENQPTGHEVGIYRVIKVGPGKYIANGSLVAPDVEPGDEVVFFGGRAIKLEPEYLYDNKRLVMVEADSVLAVVRGRNPANIHKPKEILTAKELDPAIRKGKELLHA